MFSCVSRALFCQHAIIISMNIKNHFEKYRQITSSGSIPGKQFIIPSVLLLEGGRSAESIGSGPEFQSILKAESVSSHSLNMSKESMDVLLNSFQHDESFESIARHFSDDCIDRITDINADDSVIFSCIDDLLNSGSNL